MKFGVKLRALAVTLLVMSGLGIAVAQPVPALVSGEPTPREPEPATEAPLSPAQMLTQARQYLPEMERAQNTVRVQAKKARDAKDVVKVLCLNDKLGQIELATSTATDRVTDLDNAIKRNDIERAQHQFTVVRVLRERVNTLVSEAQQCIGEETGFVGDENVTVEIDPNIANTDPSEFPEEPLVSTPPVTSSPTL
jgi:hypothetical protein